jgi:hypothetical protein
MNNAARLTIVSPAFNEEMTISSVLERVFHCLPTVFAIKLITFLSNVCTDRNLTDVETGYKAARLEIFRQMAIESSGFGFEIEFVAKCQKPAPESMRSQSPRSQSPTMADL